MSKVMLSESYLDDIADAIRSKNGLADTYKPSEMAEAISELGGATLGPKTITANDTYYASSDDLDGYSSVTVNVPNPSTGTISITSNGTVDVTQYASADVNVPSVTPTGTINITQNGTVDVTNYASASVAVPNPSTGTKQISITQNGTTTEDVTNYASAEITVNVSSAYSVATGTFTLAENNRTVEVSVPFEPTHAFCYGQMSDFTQSAWNEYAMVLFDKVQPKFLSVQARTNNGNLGFNPMLRDPSALTYLDGKFKFYETQYAFIAGRTYTWFCWRENT